MTTATRMRETVNTPVVQKTRGLLQIRRDNDQWACATVLYGSTTTFQPLSMTEERLAELFSMCNLARPTLSEDKYVVEFFDSDITVDCLRKFGFQIK